MYSYLDNPFKGWEEHLRFAQHAAAYKIQRLGNEAGLPTLDAVKEIAREFDQASSDRDADAEPRPALASVAAARRRR